MSQAELSSPITDSLPIPPTQSEACWHILPTIHCTLWGVIPGPCFRCVVSSLIHYIVDVSVANSGLFLQSHSWAINKACRVQGPTWQGYKCKLSIEPLLLRVRIGDKFSVMFGWSGTVTVYLTRLPLFSSFS